MDSDSAEKWHGLLPKVAAGMDDKKILAQLSDLAEVDQSTMLAQFEKGIGMTPDDIVGVVRTLAQIEHKDD